jgi:hypothetical protein
MSRPLETGVSQTDGNPDSGRRKTGALSDAKPTPSVSPLRPSGSSNNGPSKKPSGETRPKAEFDSQLRPEATVKATAVEKPKTLEEFDKQLAAAKTPEDYRAVAGEALLSAGKILDDHPDGARKLLLKALIAARKSRDFQLIVKVTRALAEPELTKEILAEE